MIENRGGAGGNIGLEVVAKSAPDGYTLLASSGSPIVVGPHLYKLGVDVARDLVPIAPLARILTLLVVRPGLPVRSVAELIAYARANPGKLNYGSVGSGSTLHIHAESMLRATKLQATHVPYKGAAQMVTALLSDQVDFAFDSGLTIQHIKADKLRLLAVAGATRSPIFPDTPTMAESGTEVNDALFGVYAPTGTPREIVTRLNREIGRIMQTAGGARRARHLCGRGVHRLARGVRGDPESRPRALRRVHTRGQHPRRLIQHGCESQGTKRARIL